MFEKITTELQNHEKRNPRQFILQHKSYFNQKLQKNIKTRYIIKKYINNTIQGVNAKGLTREVKK